MLFPWNINAATIVGRDHELSKKNRQDFQLSYQSQNLIVGVVCDGCGESLYSEVGASLIGTYIVNFFRYSIASSSQFYDVQFFSPSHLKFSLETKLTDFIASLQTQLLFKESEKSEKINFLDEFMLCTSLFCVLTNEIVIVGRCGDGVVVINDNVEFDNNLSDKDNKGPEYIAYKVVPKEALKTTPSSLGFFQIDSFHEKDVNSIIIGSDGIQPILDKNLMSEMYGTKKRKLQRKFNLWQEEKLFADDATCIVVEKQKHDNEDSNLQKEENNA